MHAKQQQQKALKPERKEGKKSGVKESIVVVTKSKVVRFISIFPSDSSMVTISRFNPSCRRLSTPTPSP